MSNKKKLFAMICLLPFAALFAQWQSVGQPGGNFRAMAVAPSNENIQYLAVYGSPSNIWKTTDGGNYWSHVGAVNDYVEDEAL